jgi:hypothetical protein
MAGPVSAEKHRQIAYRVELSRGITRDTGEDLFFGVYRDPEGGRVGRFLYRRHEAAPSCGLLIPDEAIPLMHVEEALDTDHRVSSFGMAIALIYRRGEQPHAGVVEMGERWDAGDLRIFLFEDDETAAAARSAV